MSQSAAPSSDQNQTLFERVDRLLNRIRPAVQSDGGDVELVEVTKEGIARIRLHGACVSCPSRTMTLHEGIEKTIREKVPEVLGVEQVH